MGGASGGVSVLALTLGMLAAGCLGDGGLRNAPGGALVRTVSQAHALLLADPYPDVLVEVDFVVGYQPAPVALEALSHILGTVARKHAVHVLGPTAIGAQASPYDSTDLALIHRATFNRGSAKAFGEAGGPNATLHVLYLNGEMKPDAQQWPRGPPLGLYSAASGIVVFPDRFDTWDVLALGPVVVPSREKVERHVVVHELGHAMGLVNAGIPMVRPHEDPGNAHHGSNPESVMFGGNYTDTYSGPTGTLDFLNDRFLEPIWSFDDYDLEDIAAFQKSPTTRGAPGGGANPATTRQK